MQLEPVLVAARAAVIVAGLGAALAPDIACAQEGPTLDATLNYIRDKLVAEGAANAKCSWASPCWST